MLDYFDLVGTEDEITWLESLPKTRESVDLLLDYINHVNSVEACLHFLMWTDILSIDTIKNLSITYDDKKFVVDIIFDAFEKELVKEIFVNATCDSDIVELFKVHGC